MIPQKDKTYVPWGHHDTLMKILDPVAHNGIPPFFPVFITGLSGNGKTLMVEQVCSQLNRKFVRVNITIETDEDDLVGGFRLQEGNTVWHYGPVVEAMKEGAVLLLDEVDLASNRIMCLQPILEGKPLFIKKINEVVQPASGFTVIATANTKGQGDDMGKFTGTNLLNEAFLERFAICLAQNYPPIDVEESILRNNSKNLDDYTIKTLLHWAAVSRKTHNEGGSNEVISTRRLVHIVNAHNILQDVGRAVELCLTRFDKHTQDSLFVLWERMYSVQESEGLENDPDCQSDSLEFDASNLVLF